MKAGPEKYRERGNTIPRSANPWQEGRSLYNEEPGIQLVYLATEGGEFENYAAMVLFLP